MYDAHVTRTNVVVDDRLLARVMQLYGLRTKREAIDFALRRTLAEADDPRTRALALEGSGWDADLDALRDEPVTPL